MRFHPSRLLSARLFLACAAALGIFCLPWGAEGAKPQTKKKTPDADAKSGKGAKPPTKEPEKPIPKATAVDEPEPEPPIVIKVAPKAGDKVEHALVDMPEYQAALQALADGFDQVAALKFERLIGDMSFSRADSQRLAEHLVDALLRARQVKRARVALTLLEVPETTFWEGQILLLERNYHDAENALKEYVGGKKPLYLAQAQATIAKAIAAQGRENTARKAMHEAADANGGPISKEADFWISESELLVGRSDSVLKRLDTGNDGKFDALVDRLHALGDDEPLPAGLTHEDVEAQFKTAYLLACALMQRADSGDLARADHLLTAFFTSKELDKKVERFMSQRLHDAVASRRAEALTLEGRPLMAEKFLRRYIAETIDSPLYDTLFAQLDEVRSDEENDTFESYLNWASPSSRVERRTFAMFYVAKSFIRSGQPDLALGWLEGLHKTAPDHPRDSEAMRLMMSIYGNLHADDRVLDLARDWRQRHGAGGKDVVDFLTGIIRFSRGEFKEAAGLFQSAAQSATDAVQRRRALFNVGIAAVMSGSMANYEKAVSALGPQSDADAATAKKQPDDASAANLILEHALHLAAAHDLGAEEALRDFLKDHPGHPRTAEAQIALAEFCLLDAPPRVKTANIALDAAETAVPPDDVILRERIAYTRVWTAEAEEDYTKVASLAQDFATRLPNSTRADEMRMKAGQAYFRLEDFSRARTQFLQLEEAHSESRYAETALFFAAKSSMSLLNPRDVDKALELFDQVYQRKGPLAMEARRQEVMIKRQQGNTADAIAVLDSMMASKLKPAGEELAALLIEKGELLVLQSRESPKNLEDAAEVFRAAAQTPGIQRQWRWRAQVLLAQTQQKMGKSNESLETSHDLIEDGIASGAGAKPLTPQEMIWFYRAGFMAADILESQKSWEPAARLCERLSQVSGTRADEAKSRSDRIRLDHFIWEK